MSITADTRIRWIASHLADAFCADHGQMFDCISQGAVQQRIVSFYETSNNRTLMFQFIGGKLSASYKPQQLNDQEHVFYVVRLRSGPITGGQSDQDLASGLISAGYMSNIIILLQTVYFPATTEDSVSYMQKEFLTNLQQMCEIVTQKITLRTSFQNVDLNDPVQQLEAKNQFQILTQEISMLVQRVQRSSSTELLYWKTQNCIFNYILRELEKATWIKPTLQMLIQQKQQVIVNNYEKLTQAIKKQHTESEDSVKYLNKIYLVLNQIKSKPINLISTEQIFQNVKMLLKSAKYYNEQDNVTKLLIEIIHELVLQVKAQLHVKSLLDYDYNMFKQARNKINQLYEQSLNQFVQLKLALNLHSSETQVFSSFLLFTQRLTQIDFVLKTESDFKTLNLCTISGVIQLQVQRNTLVSVFKNTQYNCLDERALQFNTDVQNYQLGINALEQNVVQFALEDGEIWERIHKVHQLLPILNRKQAEFQSILEGIMEQFSVLQSQWAHDLINEQLLTSNSWPDLICKINAILLLRQREHRLFTYFQRVYVKCGDLDITNEVIFQANYKYFNEYLTQVIIPEKYQPIFFQFPKVGKKICRAHKEFQLKVKDKLNLYTTRMNEMVTFYHENMVQPVFSIHEGILKLNLNSQVFTCYQTLKQAQFVNRKMNQNCIVIVNTFLTTKMHFDQLHEQISLFYSKKLNNNLFDDLLKPLRMNFIRNVNAGVSQVNWTSTKLNAFVQCVINENILYSELVDYVNNGVQNRILGKIQNLKQNQFYTQTKEPIQINEYLDQKLTQFKKCANNINEESIEIASSTLELVQYVTLRYFTNQSKQQMVQDAVQSGIYSNICPNEIKIELTKDQMNISKQIFQVIETVKQQTYSTISECYISGINQFSQELSLQSKHHPQILIDLVVMHPDYSLYPNFEIITNQLQKMKLQLLESADDIDLWDSPPNQKKILQIVSFNKMSDSMVQSTIRSKVMEKSTTQVADGPRKTFKQILNKNRNLLYLQISSDGKIQKIFKQIPNYLKVLNQFIDIYQKDPVFIVKQFYKTNPDLEAYKEQINILDSTREQVEKLQDDVKQGIFLLKMSEYKTYMLKKIQKFMDEYLKYINYSSVLRVQLIKNFQLETEESLKTKIVSIDTIRSIMKSLQKLRDFQTQFDQELYPVTEAYSYLKSKQLQISSQDEDALDNLRVKNAQLMNTASAVQVELRRVSPNYLSQLRTDNIELKETVKKFVEDYNQNGPLLQNIPPAEASTRLEIFIQKFEEVDQKYVSVNEGEILFGLTETIFAEVISFRKNLSLLSMLYTLYNDVNSKLDALNQQIFKKLNLEDLQDQIKAFQMRCLKLPQSMRQFQAYLDLKQKLADFDKIFPLIQMLLQPELIERHWRDLSKATHNDEWMNAYFQPETFILGTILNTDVIKYEDDITDIVNGAVREGEIEKKFKQVNELWTRMTFEFSEYKSNKLIFNSKVISEQVTQLEESQLLVSTLKSNKYNKPFKPQIELLDKQLCTIDEVLKLWVQNQQSFVYLDAVFQSGDISRQLPAEAKRFSQIDRQFTRLMNVSASIRNVIQITCVSEEVRILPILQTQIEMCQKNLSSYLEQKRNLFPRFCFVSDAVLLEILGNQSEPKQIQPYLTQIFDSVYQLGFSNEKNKIISMSDRSGETVDFTEPFVAGGVIEEWLQGLINRMQKTIKLILKAAVEESVEFINDLQKLVFEYPAQVALVVLQILWTQTCEQSIKANAKGDKRTMLACETRVNSFLSQLLVLIKAATFPKEYYKTAIETMITIQVHQLDIYKEISYITSIHDFNWLKQTRAYFDTQTDECYYEITDIPFAYAYEYLGVSERLVVTPLTDRCYITLAQAIGISMGGAPAGPAGTGKTETCKDLGKTVGQYVVVLNCSDQMDYLILGKIFRGIAQGGIYGDFDEFNRIDLSVMSVAAQQLGCIFSGIRQKKKQIIYTDGSILKLNLNAAYFITMNPGYAGRVELLENLKALFRSVAMICLNHERISLEKDLRRKNLTQQRKCGKMYVLMCGMHFISTNIFFAIII
ncbi:Outer-arm_dynein gamma [Hexamita inflata]|uniref:Outer-arm_dynein gamma n=1 Tax=Hexamita inflata TaxID=28002 RepID=A0ABP1H6S0_9EUKA